MPEDIRGAVRKNGKAAVFSFLAVWAAVLSYGWTVRHVLTPVLFAGAFWLFRYCERTRGEGGRRVFACAVVGAVLYTLSTVYAVWGGVSAYFDSRIFKGLSLVILLAGWGVFFHAVLRAVLVRAGALTLRQARDGAGPGSGGMKRPLLTTFVVCLVCYLPWYLYSYPGIFSPDPINQAEQFLHMIPYSNHHPVLHTLMMGACYRLGYAAFGNVNAAFGVYTFVQMALFAFAAGVVVRTLTNVFGFGRRVCVIVMLFFALLPAIAVQTVIVGKDTVFASVVMMFSCCVARVVCGGEGVSTGVSTGTVLCDTFSSNAQAADVTRKMCQREPSPLTHPLTHPPLTHFVVLGVLVCLLRTNGYYAFWVFGLCFIVLYRAGRVRAVAMVCAVIAVAAVVRGPVMGAAGVVQPDMAESLHLPMQQVARVIVNDRELAERDAEMIEDVIDTSWVKELYVPGFADNIKELVRAGHPEVLSENASAYAMMWAGIGLRYPADYLAAWADLTRGYIYPDGDYEVATIEGVYGNDFGLSWQPLIRGQAVVKLRELIIKLGSFVPLYGLLFSMGAYSWVMLLAMLVIISQGRSLQRLLVIVPGAAILLTLLIATPVADEFRYAFAYIASLPLWLVALRDDLRLNMM